jgi:hypothetical protein
LKDGYIDVPNTVGLGVRPLPDVLQAMTNRIDTYQVG